MATIAPAQAQRVVVATTYPRRPPRPRGVRLWLDQLESRVLLSAGDSIANAVGLSFLNTSAIYQTAHATEYLADPKEVQLNRISLNAAFWLSAVSFLNGGFKSST